MKSGRVRGQALLGMKPPLGLAHVKKRRDKKVLEKHKLHLSAELVASDTCHLIFCICYMISDI